MTTYSNSKNGVATKGDLEQLHKDLRKDFQDHAGLLYEKLSDEVKVVAEQYTTMDKRLMRVESKTDVLIETVGEIKMEITEMKEGVSGLKTDVSVLKTDMKGVRGDVAELKTDVTELKTDMKEVKEELLPESIKRTKKVEHRVTVLEARA